MNQKEYELKRAIGLNIRKAREAQMISQAYMSRVLKITAPSYGKIEAGITDPSMYRLLQIIEALNVPLYDILDHQLVPKTNEEIEALRVAYNKANERIIQLQQQLIKKERNDKLNQ